MDSLNRARELFLTALEHHNKGQLERAESLYREALDLAPGRPSVMNNLAALLLQLGRTDESEAMCEHLLAIDPRNAPALLNLGNCRYARGSPLHALEQYDHALSIDPDYVEALASRGKALTDSGRPEQGLASCERALAIRPDHFDALANRGGALMELRRYAEGLASFDRAVAIDGNRAEAHYNRANALRDVGRYGEALSAYARACALKPDLVYAHWNESLCRLMIGDFRHGWEKHEWRWRTSHGLPSARRLPYPLWDGARLNGALYVWGEQGLGEQILYGGLLGELRARTKTLLVEIEPRLVPLFQRSFPDIEFIQAAGGRGLATVAAHAPMGSVPRHFRNDWDDFPRREAGYLKADDQRVSALRRRLSAGQRPLIGLSWFSSTHRPSEKKSMRLSDLAPVLRLSGARFVDLQYGDTGEEREGVEQALAVSVERLVEIDNRLDLDGLAALITCCDAVVTISNTTAHLAGALGVPTWLLLPRSLPTHWYWHVDRNPNPWYPCVQVVRQPSIDDWQGAVRQAAADVANRLGL